MSVLGKRIVVSGASSGIGRAAAQILAKSGAKVVLIGRDETRLDSTLNMLEGDGHSKYVFDLNNTDEIPSFIKDISVKQGRLSGLFHAAGLEMFKPIGLVNNKSIEQIFSVSIKAALMLARGFCQKGVREEGFSTSIVFMSSVAAMTGQAGMTIYSASKGAIDGAVKSLACELAPHLIRVNAIAAGAVKTEMHDKIIARMTAESIKEYERKHLLGFGRPEDIASAAMFLLSDASVWITGTIMVVDGGYMLS
ncbi:MAG: SDR family oxidoreductase [Nitrospirae bacterium]|nr:SDR family oxidoreductase [Nitrospirota bacterium]MBF0541074.1 SDR family oxidoreductase [Nitrospirota bacterium]